MNISKYYATVISVQVNSSMSTVKEFWSIWNSLQIKALKTSDVPRAIGENAETQATKARKNEAKKVLDILTKLASNMMTFFGNCGSFAMEKFNQQRYRYDV